MVADLEAGGHGHSDLGSEVVFVEQTAYEAIFYAIKTLKIQ